MSRNYRVHPVGLRPFLDGSEFHWRGSGAVVSVASGCEGLAAGGSSRVVRVGRGRGMDLREFYGANRRDGVGRRAYDPAMVVALLLYRYSRGVRSARAIERACVEDVAFKMIAMMETPDHATIARFVTRHELALAELFGQVLGLCERPGWSSRVWSRSMGRRWRGAPVASPPAILGRSRGRSWRRPRRSMRPRMSCMAISAGTSCLISCAPGGAGRVLPSGPRATHGPDARRSARSGPGAGLGCRARARVRHGAHRGSPPGT